MKKKYRKMRIKFEQTMKQSDVWYKQEQEAANTARRLAQQNDQLLDLLLDINNSAQIPGNQRIDLAVESPPISALPALVNDTELSTAVKCDTPEGQKVYDEIRTMLDQKILAKKSNQTAKSLAMLSTSTPHRSLATGAIPPELVADLDPGTDGPQPVSYLSPDQIDDYLYDVDVTIGAPLYPTLAPAVNGNTLPSLSEKELSVRNPNSVYNWLRRHEPKIFLQDGEGSEKSSGKPGALRGAGKRASIPAPSRPDQVEFVEEDGIGYDISLSGSTTKGKRKRDDDGGYRPKGGASRPYKKKKKSEGSAGDSAPGKRGKNRVSEAASFANPFAGNE